MQKFAPVSSDFSKAKVRPSFLGPTFDLLPLGRHTAGRQHHVEGNQRSRLGTHGPRHPDRADSNISFFRFRLGPFAAFISRWRRAYSSAASDENQMIRRRSFLGGCISTYVTAPSRARDLI